MGKSQTLRLVKGLLEQLKSAAPDDVSIDYFREVDTLYMTLHALAGPGVSVELGGRIYVRVRPDRDVAFGLQLEGFTRQLVFSSPALLDLVDDLELSDDEIMSLRRTVARSPRPNAPATSVFDRVSGLLSIEDRTAA